MIIELPKPTKKEVMDKLLEYMDEMPFTEKAIIVRCVRLLNDGSEAQKKAVREFLDTGFFLSLKERQKRIIEIESME